MTNNLKIWALALVLAFASCSKDSGSDNNQSDQAIEELEETPLQANEVANNVVIQGGTKNDGTPPTPNEAISLDVSASSKTALLGEGFEVSIDSDATVTGAYLQFKANDGTMADSYYDIDIDANSSSSKSLKRLIGKNHKTASFITAKENDDTLDVDFNSNIEPGTFCYVICVYDADGNISAPQEVCVTVESWGGNSEIVGTWNIVKEVQVFNGESEVVSFPGDEDCAEERVIECASQETLTANEYCYITVSGKLIFKDDGTFEYEFLDTEKQLDTNASIESCSAVYEEFEDVNSGNGNWAYLLEEEKFIAILYEEQIIYDGETENFQYESGDGALFVEDGSGLRFEDDYLVFSIDEGSTDSFKSFFEKE
ncbi:hypothetical protein [Flagellimonas sp. CMM7]|uniref:hypothetical protein n=1 Tax=Flagellimonas sp. CMM7 TaxID=2654676 RepID=UPI0013D2DC96|nr:hypothetical protein [Flagellimonas sp. CMM7]UII81359.1 DUF4998 domain-containing protein [Flagellimonas sp. CMM7]